MVKKICFCIYEFIIYILINRIVFKLVPFWLVRKFFLLPFSKVGKGSEIGLDVYFYEPRYLKIGSHTHINRNCVLDSRAPLKIGNNCSISFDVKLITGSHELQSPTFEYNPKSIIIDDYVWIGVGAIILGGGTYF